MTSIVVSGYASLDHAMAVDRAPLPDRTAVVRQRLSRPWPGQGGCGPTVARGVAAAGCAAELVSWFGDDALGVAYVDDLRAAGVGVTGVDVRAGGRTACSWLLYDPDGGTTCIYDPGDHRPDALTSSQRRLVGAADWVVLTVGPRDVNRQIVDLAGHARLVLAVKADPDAFPADLVRTCLGRAAVVAFSRGERAFLEEAAGQRGLAAYAPGRLLIETLGVDGVRVVTDGHERMLRVDPVATTDTTGAGDTLLANALAALTDHADWPPDPGAASAAVANGIDAARAFLLQRVRQQRN